MRWATEVSPTSKNECISDSREYLAMNDEPDAYVRDYLVWPVLLAALLLLLVLVYSCFA